MNAPWPKSIQQKNFCKISFKSISLSRAYNYRTIEKTSVAKITGIMENGTVPSLLTEYEKNKIPEISAGFLSLCCSVVILGIIVTKFTF